MREQARRDRQEEDAAGARATIITLKMNPAAAAPSAARTKSTPELISTCSLSIITSTAR